MLSICIPIYNYDVQNLVVELHQQGEVLCIPFEIILMDDASDVGCRKQNEQLAELQYVVYIQLPENVGRSKIRNFLAEKAVYENLLFLDCDVSLIDDLFLKRYIDVIDKHSIISGGRIYTKKPPAKNYYFHWYYGTNRETKSGNFMSNNFLMKRNLWNEVKFNEAISKYGHEDTLFQIELERNGFRIAKYNNPVVHIGLDNNMAFLQKSEICIENSLFILNNQLINDKELKYFRLLSIYKKINQIKAHSIFRFFYNLTGKKMQSLLIKNPKLFLFDLYKLLYICHIEKK